MQIVHKKILPEFFRPVYTGEKNFEIRKDEDNIEPGDLLVLDEWDGRNYTGRIVHRTVKYVLRDAEDYGLMSGYCIIGFGF